MLQSQALEILKSGANVFLTGEPGSGKTHVVNEYVRYLRDHGVFPAVTASTGIAATHIGGITVHAWSGIGIKKSLDARDAQRLAESRLVSRRVGGARVLVIDEVSMLDAEALSSVAAVCQAARKDASPFGGMQVVFVGDFFQLPPVSREGEPPAKFTFLSPAWEEADPVVCYLGEQHRQRDSAFLAFLAAVRRGGMAYPDAAAALAPRAAGEEARRDCTRLYTHNVDVDRENARRLAALAGEERKFVMESHGQKARVATLKRYCLSPEVLSLKPGAAVMFTKNNFEDGYVNGTRGTVEGFSKEDGYPLVRVRGGGRIRAMPAEWSVSEGEKVVARVRQVPLRLAWAITVHKSQGITLESAVMDLAEAFEYGQGYVALSRVSSFEGLWLLGHNETAFKVHPEILAYDTRLRECSREAAARLAAVPLAVRRRREREFIRACGGKRR